MSYNVLIIGAGQIGAFYDSLVTSSPLACQELTIVDAKSKRSQAENAAKQLRGGCATHAHAFSVTEGFRLVGFVDVDVQKAKSAAERWNTKAFSTLEEAFQAERIDVVCVAVPDNYHYQILQAVAEYPVKLVFAEKPFCGDVEQAKEILAKFQDKQVPIQVNYSRRFVPEFQQLAQRIQSGEFGKCLGGMGLYGKGLIHNGSHMVNLLQFLFGTTDIRPGVILGSINDAYSYDPSLSLQWLLPDDAYFTLQAVDARAVTLFEFDLLFERQRIRMLKSGFLIYYFDVAENSMFAGYQNYVMGQTVEPQLGQALKFAAENIKAHLDQGEPLVSSAESAIQTLEILARVVGNRGEAVY